MQRTNYEPTDTGLKQNNRLKWKPRRPSAFRVNREFSGSMVIQSSGVWVEERGEVRRAAELRPVSPLDDPFGDHAPRLQSQSQSRPAAITLEPPRNGSRTAAIQPIQPPADAEPVAPPKRGQLPAPKTGPCPMQPCDKPYMKDPNNDVIYNERNCCEHQHNCRCHKELIKNNTIDKISLDLSAGYFLEGVDDPEKKHERMDMKEMFPSRVWKDRQGNVLGEGRLVDFSHGRPIIVNADGQRQTLPPVAELGEDEVCFLTAYWDLPYECRFDDLHQDLAHGREHWIASTVTWKASALCHKPLYFEDIRLERYGHSAGPFRQPIKSTAHFFLNIAFLPYNMGINEPRECQYALGYYRPGDCAPWLVDPIPLSVRGAAAQTAAVAAGIYWFP